MFVLGGLSSLPKGVILVDRALCMRGKDDDGTSIQNTTFETQNPSFFNIKTSTILNAVMTITIDCSINKVWIH